MPGHAHTALSARRCGAALQDGGSTNALAAGDRGDALPAYVLILSQEPAVRQNYRGAIRSARALSVISRLSKTIPEIEPRQMR